MVRAKQVRLGACGLQTSRQEGPAPSFHLSLRELLSCPLRLATWNHLAYTLSDASPAERGPWPSDSPWEPSTEETVCTVGVVDALQYWVPG